MFDRHSKRLLFHVIRHRGQLPDDLPAGSCRECSHQIDVEHRYRLADERPGFAQPMTDATQFGRAVTVRQDNHESEPSPIVEHQDRAPRCLGRNYDAEERAPLELTNQPLVFIRSKTSVRDSDAQRQTPPFVPAARAQKMPLGWRV